jgi:hypothetical protein
MIVHYQYRREVYQDVAVNAGETFEASGWVMTNGVGGAGARICLIWLDALGLPDEPAAGSVLRTDVLGTLSGSQEWTRLSGKHTAPSGANAVRFQLYTAVDPDSDGAAWFDDNELIRASVDVVPAAVFRAYNGKTMLTSYGSTGLYNAVGFITCEPGISQNAGGDTFVVGRNQTTRVYLNVFRNETRSWTGWMFVGDRKEGAPAVAATSNGEAYIVARDGSYRYWLSRYRPGQGFENWIYLGGTFATEPAIAAATDDSVYIVGAAANGVVSSGRYVSGSGFQGWVPAGSPPLAAGKPAITVGSDGAAYVAIKATINGISMARLEGNSWGSWYHGGGNIGNGPALAATGGFIYVAVTTPVGAVYVQPFGEGTGNGWQGAWTFLNGHLEGAAIAATSGRFYIAGRSLLHYFLWWYESGVGWTRLGCPGLAASELTAGPK